MREGETEKSSAIAKCCLAAALSLAALIYDMYLLNALYLRFSLLLPRRRFLLFYSRTYGGKCMQMHSLNWRRPVAALDPTNSIRFDSFGGRRARGARRAPADANKWLAHKVRAFKTILFDSYRLFLIAINRKLNKNVKSNEIQILLFMEMPAKALWLHFYVSVPSGPLFPNIRIRRADERRPAGRLAQIELSRAQNQAKTVASDGQ